VGLGNPGPEYEDTRHNAGFLLADHLAARWRAAAFRRADRGRETRASVAGVQVRLLKPWTYMNRSGAALASLRDVSGFDPARHLLVLHDEAAFPIGRFRLRASGSAGGHNGLKSVEASLRTREYARLRIGVGPVPPGIEDLADWVLGPFERDERTALNELLDPMADAVECWLTDGIEKAMNRFNRVREGEES
jgi:PTH1 family peptidyl-tRNA hydrolase